MSNTLATYPDFPGLHKHTVEVRQLGPLQREPENTQLQLKALPINGSGPKISSLYNVVPFLLAGGKHPRSFVAEKVWPGNPRRTVLGHLRTSTVPFGGGMLPLRQMRFDGFGMNPEVTDGTTHVVMALLALHALEIHSLRGKGLNVFASPEAAADLAHVAQHPIPAAPSQDILSELGEFATPTNIMVADDTSRLANSVRSFLAANQLPTYRQSDPRQVEAYR